MNTIRKMAPAPNAMQVQTTKDYSIFRELAGNRVINDLHKKRLMNSMRDVYLISPIIINEMYEVIDGQHRLECARELNLPIYYVICHGYGLREVQILNVNSRNWSLDDYMNGYCELGMKDYIRYREFKSKYKFTHQECATMLTGNTSGGGTDTPFKTGEFKVKNEKQAYEWAELINSLEPYYDGYLRRSFVYAMIIMLKNPEFKFKEFISKLKFQQGKLYDCAKVPQYVDLIEEIYNYRRQNKISLKY